MMLHPEGAAVFVEVPKTGSTAVTLHLRKAKWFQNGSRGTKLLPGTFPGRHAQINEDLSIQLKQLGVTSYGVVRNPWHRMASLWRSSAPGSTSFKEYMTTGRFKHGPIDIMRTPQHEWLKFVDHRIKYEELERSWDQMAHQFGHLPLGPIQRANVSKNRRNPDWTEEEVELVRNRFWKDAELYGYDGP